MASMWMETRFLIRRDAELCGISRYTSAEYTEDEMTIYYTFERDYADPTSEDIRSNKKAVLKPTENGLFRIVSIEEVDQSSQTAEADVEAGQNRTAESAQSAGSVKDAYTSVLKSISAHEPGFEFSIAGDSAESYEYFLQDMDGDGTEELIVGARVADGPFYVYDCRVFTLSQNGGTTLQPVGDDFSAMSLYIPSDGNGLFTYEFSRGTGEVYISRITISNGSLKVAAQNPGSRWEIPQTSSLKLRMHNLRGKTSRICQDWTVCHRNIELQKLNQFLPATGSQVCVRPGFLRDTPGG